MTRSPTSFCWTGRRASTSHSGICELTAQIAPATATDADELAAIAAQTFPLACPPNVGAEDIAAFVAANLSAARFAGYLADPRRAILTARSGGQIAGYAMLVRGDEADGAGLAVELSKIYVVPECHGDGTARALMSNALATAAGWRARNIWLGVNQKNQRAQRFYARSGFTVTGTRTFQLGTHVEHDFIMSRDLA